MKCPGDRTQLSKPVDESVVTEKPNQREKPLIRRGRLFRRPSNMLYFRSRLGRSPLELGLSGHASISQTVCSNLSSEDLRIFILDVRRPSSRYRGKFLPPDDSRSVFVAALWD